MDWNGNAHFFGTCLMIWWSSEVSHTIQWSTKALEWPFALLASVASRWRWIYRFTLLRHRKPDAWSHEVVRCEADCHLKWWGILPQCLAVGKFGKDVFIFSCFHLDVCLCSYNVNDMYWNVLRLYDSKHVDVWIDKSDQGGNGGHLSHVWSWYRNKLDPDWGRYVFCLRLYTSQEFLFRPWLHTKTSKKKSDWETAVNFKTLKSSEILHRSPEASSWSQISTNMSYKDVNTSNQQTKLKYKWQELKPKVAKLQQKAPTRYRKMLEVIWVRKSEQFERW